MRRDDSVAKLLIAATIEMTVKKFFLPYGDHFRSIGWHVDCISNPEDLPFEECEEHFDNRLFISWTRNPFNITNYCRPLRQIRKLLAEGCYDIVHVHTPVAAFLTRIAFAELKNRTGVKIVYTVHGFHFYKGAPLLNWILYFPIEKWLSRYTDVLITINKEDYDSAVQNSFKAGKICRIPGVGVDLSKFIVPTAEEKQILRQRHGWKREHFLLLFAGDYNKNKNQKFLIEAMKKIVKRDHSVMLLLAGAGPDKAALEKLIRDRGLADNIFILGFRKDMPEIIAMSDVGVSASIREGLPLNIIETLACGVPVVASDNRGHREIIRDGINGYLYQTGEMDTFVDHVLRLRSNSEIYMEIASGCRATVEKYSLVPILKKTEEIYSDLLKQQNGA